MIDTPEAMRTIKSRVHAKPEAPKLLTAQRAQRRLSISLNKPEDTLDNPAIHELKNPNESVRKMHSLENVRTYSGSSLKKEVKSFQSMRETQIKKRPSLPSFASHNKENLDKATVDKNDSFMFVKPRPKARGAMDKVCDEIVKNMIHGNSEITDSINPLESLGTYLIAFLFIS
jgi:hypothetical protein